jgi:phenylacetic acid degradation operon negative regulatory protein
VPRRRLPDLGLEPLSARSLVLSTLLGTHPPRLSARSLVVLGEQFGIAEGTMRTALSRMAGAGELEADGGEYQLGARFKERQALQDEGLRVPEEPWDGSWWLATVTVPSRAIAERRAFRSHMVSHRMGELRPDTWLRPANVSAPTNPGRTLIIRGSIDYQPDELIALLWDIDDVDREARHLLALAEGAISWLDAGDPTVLPDSLFVCIAVVRFLRTEPQLPKSIVGPRWPPNALRHTYAQLQKRHAALVGSFLNEEARSADEAIS